MTTPPRNPNMHIHSYQPPTTPDEQRALLLPQRRAPGVWLTKAMRPEELLSLVFFFLELRAARGQVFPPNICVSWQAAASECPGGDRSLTTTGVALTYSYAENSISGSSQEILLDKRTLPQTAGYAPTYNGTQNTAGTSKSVRYTFSQKEHGGGECNCVLIHFDMDCSSSQR